MCEFGQQLHTTILERAPWIDSRRFFEIHLNHIIPQMTKQTVDHVGGSHEMSSSECCWEIGIER